MPYGRRRYNSNSSRPKKSESEKQSEKVQSLIELSEKQIQSRINKEDKLITSLSDTIRKCDGFAAEARKLKGEVERTKKEISQAESRKRFNETYVNEFYNYHNSSFLKKPFLKPPVDKFTAARFQQEMLEWESKLIYLTKQLEQQILALNLRTFEMDGIMLNVTNFEDELYSLRTKISKAESRLVPLRKARELVRAKETDIKAREKKAEEEVGKYKAYAAAYFDETRKQGASVRKELHNQEETVKGCPYCGSELDEVPHADHIWPISKGGLSNKDNMVFVCSKCNLKKSDLTLREFVNKHNMDRDFIERNLDKLGKKF